MSLPDADKPTNLDDEQLSTLVHSLGAAAHARVPLEVTLAALAEERDDPSLAKVARRLSVQVENGASIDQAVAVLGPTLPPEFAGVLRAGVESGDLAGTVDQFAQQRLAARRVRLRLRRTLAYPLVILAILVPIALFMSLYVIPIFGQMYREFGLELPTLSILVLIVARQLPLWIFALFAILFGLPMLLRLVGGSWLKDRIWSAVPLLGRLSMWSGQREFAAMLSSFLDSRLPLGSAIHYTSDVLRDRGLARACRSVGRRVEQGQPLSQSLAQSIHFDRALVALVAWGETRGLLPEALRVAAEVFDDRIEQRAAWLRRILPPITLIVVASFMFIIVASLMIPLVRLIEGLSG
jgi:type II secretory pathway component PulF